jgi:nucleotide-binding universal stress UspA family protein
MRLRKILVPLDGSRLAEAALTEAIQLSGAGARLLLLRAVEAPRVPIADPTDAQVKVVRAAEAYLAAIADRAREAGVTEVDTSVWYGAPGEAIVDTARVRDIDLIVMCTHGRSGIGRLVLGSVAETVLRGTRTPILLVRDQEAPLAPIAPGGARSLKENVHV